ncbi:Monocyte to macrophage differentiation factor 2 [Armadillidium nasatum]|uniref:Monocyte to macrophage differentiation factor 2 n=1 Tax=Armadillidium nasatum TaxID=96803 RepID=A0A5N5SV44_9CRUS|nr:Monocyte to macrophage differentiation factor 2 [Armadillidium nasatum]
MNERPLGKAAYQPTSVEHWANMVTHGVFVLPAVYGAIVLYESSKSDMQRLASGIYGLALVGLFTVSTIFHVFFYKGHFRCLKEVLHRSDRAMIYIFIASSYTPWLLLKPLPMESWAVHLRWGIWVLAVLGIIYQQVFHERFKMIETLFYIFIGVFPSLSVVEMEDAEGFSELRLGGIVYILGVIFFKLDGRIPLAHAIWHLFVVLASFIHYFAVLNHLILPLKEENNRDNTLNLAAKLVHCDVEGEECTLI